MMSTPSRHDDTAGTTPRLTPAEETRAAIDVMFEALSHIQASLEQSSEEARSQSYRSFKNALYRRFEQVVEDRQAMKRKKPVSKEQKNAPVDPALSQDADVKNADVSANGAREDCLSVPDKGNSDGTLEKLWPTISPK